MLLRLRDKAVVQIWGNKIPFSPSNDPACAAFVWGVYTITLLLVRILVLRGNTVALCCCELSEVFYTHSLALTHQHTHVLVLLSL